MNPVLKLRNIVLTLLIFLLTFSEESNGQESSGKGSNEQEKMTSLVEVAPQLIKQVMHYPKFYGDPLTVNGSLLERSYVTGDWGGLRDKLNDRGIYPFLQVTQFMEGNLSGGNASELRNNGSMDYGLWIDTGKANLWSGGGFFLHAETGWAESKNADVGTTVPSNIDATRPNAISPGPALSEFYFIQVLSPKYKIAIGKMDLGAWADTNLWANNWKYQFSSAALVNNPQLAAIIPYTTYAAWVTYTATDDLYVVYTVNTEDSTATQAGFDTIFNGNMVNSLQFIYTPDTRKGLPSKLNVIVGYGSGDHPDFAVNERSSLRNTLSTVPHRFDRVDGNYGIIISGSSYLAGWDSGLPKGSLERPSKPLGFGYFWRYGATPQDRNVISQFFSAGLGGQGGFAGRIHDNWGVGWGGSYMSPELRNVIPGINVWENVTEIFYNARITPSTMLTVNFQVADPALAALDTSYAVGMRLQIDF